MTSVSTKNILQLLFGFLDRKVDSKSSVLDVTGSKMVLSTTQQTEDEKGGEPSRKYIRGLFSYSAYVMSPLIIDCVCAILQECMDQLQVLEQLYKKAGFIDTHYFVDYHPLAQRFATSEAGKKYDKYRINEKYTIDHKLQKEINLLCQILLEGCNEIKSDGTYTNMLYVLKCLYQMAGDEYRLLEEEAANKKKVHDLRNMYLREKEQQHKIIEEKNATINELKFKYEDILGYNNEKIKFLRNWEDSRSEQNNLTCRYKENIYSSTIKDMKNRTDYENRCHAELVNFIAESQDAYLQDIEYWMKRYDDTMEKLEEDTIALRNDSDAVILEQQHLEQEYAKRTKEIAEWKEYKRQKEEEEKFKQKKIQAATKIQAWWRGVMFRKKLGPYRKKKGKGKKGDKKGGKKGGKKK